MKCAYYCLLAIAQLTSHALHCQFYLGANNKTEPELLWEAGISAGAINCLTDIGGNNGKGKRFIKDINWNQTRPAAGLFVSAGWHYLFAIKLDVTTGRVSGNDNVLKNSSGIARERYFRNLQFRTNITEASITTELYPLQILDNNREITALSPYLEAGAGLFYYNPQALMNDTWIDLRPLHTEGEGFKEYPDRNAYGPITWCLPVGAGIKYDAARLINFRFEIKYRFTGTDYLDDVSTTYINATLFNKYLPSSQAAIAAQLADRTGTVTNDRHNKVNDIRGNPLNKDAWFTCMFSMSIALGRMQRK